MFQKLIRFCVKLVQKYLPEPFIFAVVLTLLAFIIAMPVCKQTPLEVVEHWGNGVWSLLAFAMQMALVLVTGSALAAAPSIKKGISALAGLPKTPAGAIALVTGISALACWLNWGFGLIVGVIFAKEIAKKLRGVDYRLLIASAYSGFVVWHAGLSGSIPLTMASKESNLEKVTNGTLTQPIPVSETILTYQNLIMVAVVIVAIVVVNALMHPKGEHVVTIEPSLLFEEEPKPFPKATTPAEKLENSRILSWIISLLGLTYLVIKLFVKGGTFDLGAVIMLFLFLGVILHGTPLAYVKAFGKSVGLCFHFHAKDLSFVHLLLCSHFEYVCAIGWRSLGHSSADYVHGRCCLGCGPWLDGHGYLMGRCLDQSHPAFLGFAGLGHCQAQRQGHHGFLHH